MAAGRYEQSWQRAMRRRMCVRASCPAWRPDLPARTAFGAALFLLQRALDQVEPKPLRARRRHRRAAAFAPFQHQPAPSPSRTVQCQLHHAAGVRQRAIFDRIGGQFMDRHRQQQRLVGAEHRYRRPRSDASVRFPGTAPAARSIMSRPAPGRNPAGSADHGRRPGRAAAR